MTAQLKTVPREALVTDRELIDRARALGPLLAKNALASEQDRRAHRDNIDAIRDAGLFRLMVPKRFGGHQASIRTHLEVTAALAESCAGTAWVAALTNVCAWFVGLYPRQAQEEVFGANPDARVAGVFTPSNNSQRVDGGLIVSGKWFWSSGSLHADWVTVGVMEHDRNGAYVGQYLALLPRSEITIEDTWFTVGMRASGSNCVVAKDVFVPNHRLLDIQAALNGVRIEGGEIYTTASPCWNCFKLIANAGLVAVYFGEFYREPRIHDYADRVGIRLHDLSAR